MLNKKDEDWFKQLSNGVVQDFYISEARKRNLRLVDPRYQPRQRLIDKILDSLSPNQHAFVEDSHTGVEATCGRQAGKTWGVGAKLAKACEETPNVICPYVAITGKAARRIVFPVLKEMNYHYGIGLHFNETELISTFPNGSSIQLFGADEEKKRDSLRGSPFKIFAVDEAAFHGSYLKSFAEGVIIPSLVKYRGQIILISNPNPQCNGYLYDVAHSDNRMWGKHHWSILDNPFIPHAKEWLQNLKEMNKWDDNNPTYRREWLGEWVKDDSIMVYTWMNERLVLDEEPDENLYEYVNVGIDFGFYPDTTAFGVIGWSSFSPKIYLLESFEYNNLTTSDIEDNIKMLVKNYNPVSIRGDSAGGGKQLIASINEDLHISPKIEAADKREKRAFQEKINDAMRKGDFQIYRHKNLKFIEQAKALCRDETGIDDERCKNNITDAVLYSYRSCKHKEWQPTIKTFQTKNLKVDEYVALLKEKEAERNERLSDKNFFKDASVNEEFYA